MTPGDRPPTACKRAVSGTLSLPTLGYFSPFPHGTRALSVAEEYLALEDGPPGFRPGFSCPAVLGDQEQRGTRVVYGTLTLCGGTFQSPSTTTPFAHSVGFTPLLPRNPLPFARQGLGSSPFARHY
jgi:hypothetical protein